MTATVGFVGTGNMGAAIIRGLSSRKDIRLAGTDLDRVKLAELESECGLVPAANPAELVRMSDYVVLAVKPQHLAAVVRGFAAELTPGKCLVSIAAGATMATLAELTGDVCSVVRVMPNTPALVAGGATALCFDDAKLTPEQKAVVTSVFESVGRVYLLPEKSFDAFTAVVGSGPAYVLAFMEALIESGVTLGLTRPEATDMVIALFEGTSKLARETGTHPSILREMVTSPAGTTIQALNHMDRMAVRGSIIDAVRASWARSIELGQK